MSLSIAIVGGGPSALFLIKRLIEQQVTPVTIDLFERRDRWAAGMPYSPAGANEEHVTNVSGNEIPEMMDSLAEWIKALPEKDLDRFQIDREAFTAYKVVPRLLFGAFLEAQFEQYISRAEVLGMQISRCLHTLVTDVDDDPQKNEVVLTYGEHGEKKRYDKAIICIGHRWPKHREGRIPGFYDSPYPPAKLTGLINQSVALKGCSLTAIDAIRTIARANGRFIRQEDGALQFESNPEYSEFRLLMYSRHAILPGLRFHLEDPQLSRKSLLTKTDFDLHRVRNGGFISLDFIFENNFKARFQQTDPDFYKEVKDWSMEQFVAVAMESFTSDNPFELFKAEFRASLESIRQGKSEYWKEKLAILSVAMNYPAKYLSAEDTRRLHHVLMPLISVVIAFAPQSSCEELIALHEAGKLDLVRSANDAVDLDHHDDGIRVPFIDFQGNEKTETFDAHIDCTGQPHLSIDDFPLPSLVAQGAVSQAKLKFQDPAKAIAKATEIITQQGTNYFLDVPGLAITDHFRSVSKNGTSNPRLYMMAVPYIGGYNPDYSGLDFCDDASKAIVADLNV